MIDGKPCDPDISIHAPNEGCDLRCKLCSAVKRYFNPRTQRGVRPLTRIPSPELCRISIHAPNEGCDDGVSNSNSMEVISIHAPNEGCDLTRIPSPELCRISIHAPNEGCDENRRRRQKVALYFNPRTQRGVRPVDGGIVSGRIGFQSTHPTRGATGRWE